MHVAVDVWQQWRLRTVATVNDTVPRSSVARVWCWVTAEGNLARWAR